jgi:alkylation response protein AidB-like acyl-CoA dehydrogenase
VNTELSELHDAARQVVSGLGIAADEQAAWSTVAELGWLMVSTPEEQGGLGMGLAGACALHLELGRGLATPPFLPAMLAIEAVCTTALVDREAWLERLTTGTDYIAAPLAQAQLHFERNDAGVVLLTGTAIAVPSADRASHALVSADDCVALVPLEQAGVTRRAQPTWDETRRLYDLEFAGVALDPELILASGAYAQTLVSQLSVQRDFALAADCVGGAQALLELTVEYLQTRQQFGRPLALFQALKHRCADLKAQVEAAQALLLDNLDRLDKDSGSAEAINRARLLGRAAKQLACSAYATVAEESLQLHGGIGMTAEHGCHLFLKRAMLNEHLGDPPDSYDIGLAQGLLDSL